MDSLALKAMVKKGKKIMGEIWKWLLILLKPLLNERGQAGEDDDEEAPDSQAESEDESGDIEDEDEAEDDTESDEDLEEDEEPEDNLVPQKRVNEIVATERTAKEEAERKLDEFKRLGPEAYYKLYPDETPDEPETKEEDEEEEAGFEPDTDEIKQMVVRGGKFDGMTLAQVFSEDPVEATLMLNNYLDSQKSQMTKAAQAEEKAQQESEKDVADFMDARSNDAFGKAYADLSADEKKQIEALTDEVLDFIDQNPRRTTMPEDAFFLMNKDGLLKDVKSKAAKAVISQLADANFTSSVSTSNAETKKTGYGDYLSLSREALAEKLDRMDDEEQEKFLKKATPEFRKKFPDLPYPD